MKYDTLKAILGFLICFNTVTLVFNIFVSGLGSLLGSGIMIGLAVLIRRSKSNCLMGTYIVIAVLQAGHVLITMTLTLLSLIYWAVFLGIQGSISYFFYQVISGKVKLPEKPGPDGENVPEDDSSASDEDTEELEAGQLLEKVDAYKRAY